MSGNSSIEIVPASDAPPEINRPLGFDLTFSEMRARVEALNEFYKGVMQQGTDYDVIPGTQKPCLLQPGAQLLDGIFGLAATFDELPSSVKDWEHGFFHVEMRCRLVSRHTGGVAAEGIGSCNSKEDRYRWRAAKRRCPQCGAEAIIKGKAEYGGGWVCFKKQDGCGAKFRDGDSAIDGQATGRVENEDPYSLVNTISKMAQKRAHLAATLNATGASRIFTQDVEDLPPFAAPVAPANGHAPRETTTPSDTVSQTTDPDAAHMAEADAVDGDEITGSYAEDVAKKLSADLNAAFRAQAPAVVVPDFGFGEGTLTERAHRFAERCATEPPYGLALPMEEVKRALGGTLRDYMKATGRNLDSVYAVLKTKVEDDTAIPDKLGGVAATE